MFTQAFPVEFITSMKTEAHRQLLQLSGISAAKFTQLNDDAK